MVDSDKKTELVYLKLGACWSMGLMRHLWLRIAELIVQDEVYVVALFEVRSTFCFSRNFERSVRKPVLVPVNEKLRM